MATATAVRERPIIFSAPMVRAILDGRKTQTRRVLVLPQWANPVSDENEFEMEYSMEQDDGGPPAVWPYATAKRTGCLSPVSCPYGDVGDRLWVKETFQRIPDRRPAGYWTNPELIGVNFWYKSEGNLPTWGGKWKSPIYMPREASRLTLEVVSVRVQRLKEISDEDARAEGAAGLLSEFTRWPGRVDTGRWTVLEEFEAGWDSLNAKRGFPWAANPWVWAVEFRRHDRE